MPTTPAQSLRDTLLCREETGDEDDNSDIEEEVQMDSPRSGNSGLRYDVRELSPVTKNRLFDNLRNENFKVDFCRELYNEEKPYWAIGIVQRLVIRIGPPGSGHEDPMCSFCEQHACRHVIWLRDVIAGCTLAQYKNSGNPEGDLKMLRDGSATGPGVRRPYEQIHAAGADTLAAVLDWEYSSASRDETAEEAKLRAKCRDVANVRDMLACLSNQRVDDYRADIFHNVPNTIDTTHPLHAQSDLETNLAHLLISRKDLYLAFRQELSPAFCALEHFRKLRLYMDEAYEAHDMWIRTGQYSVGDKPCDIAWMGQQLIDIINSVVRYTSDHAPMAPEARDQAAALLVSILDSVVGRQADVYTGNRVLGQRPRNENLRSLFGYLIMSTGDRSPAQGVFVVEALNWFVSDARNLVPALERIISSIPVAPSAYLEKLRSQISRIRGSPSTYNRGAAPGPRGDVFGPTSLHHSDTQPMARTLRPPTERTLPSPSRGSSSGDSGRRIDSRVGQSSKREGPSLGGPAKRAR